MSPQVLAEIGAKILGRVIEKLIEGRAPELITLDEVLDVDAENALKREVALRRARARTKKRP